MLKIYGHLSIFNQNYKTGRKIGSYRKENEILRSECIG